MSKIEEMLKNENVEWKKLGEIIERHSEKARRHPEIKVVYTVSKEYGIISSLDYWKKTASSQRSTYQMYSEDTSNYNIIEKDMFAYNPARLNIGSISCLLEGESGLLSPMYVVFKIDKNIILPKYLLYFIKSPKVLRDIDSMKESGARFRFDFENWNKINIPIPSLKTQEKIVKTLDKFTEYVTELQAELQYRTNQYKYYRNMLLSEEYLNKLSKKILYVSEGENMLYCSNLEYMRELIEVKLETIVKIKNGKDWKKLGKGNIPVYGSGGNMDIYVDKYSYNKPSVLIPRKGSIENVFYLEEPFWNVDTIFYTEIDESKIIPRYLYYFISNYDIKLLSTDSTRPSLTQEALNRIVVQLPPLSLQNKIVEILDKFQAMLSETKGLLPKEIEERQKQYEYYREKLLTFDVESGTHARTHATNC